MTVTAMGGSGVPRRHHVPAAVVVRVAVDRDRDHPAIRRRADDVRAAMGSRERLWEKYGEAWGWPPASMTSIDPPEFGMREGADPMVSWWVVDGAVGSELERALDDLVPGWLAETWGFAAVESFP